MSSEVKLRIKGKFDIFSLLQVGRSKDRPFFKRLLTLNTYSP